MALFNKTMTSVSKLDRFVTGIAIIAFLHLSCVPTCNNTVCCLQETDKWPENCGHIHIMNAVEDDLKGGRYKVYINYSTVFQSNGHGTLSRVKFIDTCNCSCDCTCQDESQKSIRNISSEDSKTSVIDNLIKTGCYQYVFNPGNRRSCCFSKHEKPRGTETNIGNMDPTTAPTQTSTFEELLAYFRNNWVTLVVIACTILLVFCFYIFYSWKRLANRVLSIEGNSVELAKGFESATYENVIKNRNILLMYASDCDSFKSTSNLLYLILKSALKCRIYDPNQDDCHGDICEQGDHWLNSKLNECDKVIVVSSEAALSLECTNTTYMLENPLNRLQKYFFSQYLFNLHAIAHSKLIFVRFENFSPDVTAFPKLFTPPSMYTLPTLLGELLDILDPSSKSHENFTKWEEDLNESIQNLSLYKQNNPQYLTEILKQ